MAVAALAAVTGGCVSTQTRRTLDRSYEAATARGRQAPGRPTERSGNSEVDLSGSLERDVVVAAAVARSPALAMMAHRARALVHAGRAEGSLPSAELGFEAWNLPLARPYALGEADMYMSSSASASQRLALSTREREPWPRMRRRWSPS